MGSPAKLPSSGKLDGWTESNLRRSNSAGKHQLGVPVMAHQLPEQSFSGCHSPKRQAALVPVLSIKKDYLLQISRCENDKWSSKRPATEFAAFVSIGPDFGSPIFPELSKMAAMAKFAIRSVLFPRAGAGETKVWSAWMEYSVRI